MTFSKILGNDPIKTYLEYACSHDVLHHALLFSGADGIGKSMFAKALARKLLLSGETRISQETHPDLHILRPEGKGALHPVENIRGLIEEVHKPPFEAERKVFILYDADRMQAASANALLKTLEEPDLATTLILLTSSVQELLPTIVSRCLHLSFQPLSVKEIRELLAKSHEVPLEKAEQLARLSGGSIGVALKWLLDEKLKRSQRLLFDAMDKTIFPWQAIEEIESLLEDIEGFECKTYAHMLLEAMLMRARDGELLLAKADARLLYFPQEKPCTIAFKKLQEQTQLVSQALERNVKLSVGLEQILNV